MDAQEHKLVIGMLATHLGMLSGLIEALRENGTLTKADQVKIWKDAFSTGPEKAHFLNQVTVLYQSMASALGLKLDLGDFPQKASQ